MIKTTLGNISEIITGPFGSQLHMTDYVETGIPVIMPQNIENRSVSTDGIARIKMSDFNRLKRYSTKRGDLVFSRRGDVEKHAFIGTDELALCGTGCLRVRIINENVDALFLSFYLNRPETRKWLSVHAVGSNMPNLNTEILASVPIEIPDLSVQTKTAKLLQAIDKKIQNNNRINDNLQQQLKLLYDYWFNQFNFPDENGNPYRTSGGKMVWNDMYGEQIPAYWRVVKLSECIERIATGLNPRDNFKLGTGSIKYITVKNLTTNGQLDLSGCDTVDAAAREVIHKRSDIKIGDILFASISPLGRCYYITSEPDDWDINESVFSIRADNEKISPEYLYEFLSGDRFIKQAEANSTGSIFKGIRINTLLDTPIVLPPHKTVMQFSNEIHTLFMLQDKYNSENQKLVTMRDWLLPMLMNGQATIAD